MRARTSGAAAAVLLAISALAGSAPPRAPAVLALRVPAEGIQPRIAVDERGTVHLVFFRGDAAHGDVFYARSAAGALSFSTPIQVDSVPGSAIATGTVRGAQIAAGARGRVHIAWNGSRADRPGATPMFYARLNDAGTAFEAQRSVSRASYNIDGGGAVAADGRGRVYVAWHANAAGEGNEGQRKVWVARSNDEGASFEQERAAFDEPTGACGCCGLGAFIDTSQRLYILFRSAFQVVHRDMYLLTSTDGGRGFEGNRIDRWNVGACVMSTQAFAEGPSGVFTAWETEGQIRFGRIDPNQSTVANVIDAPGDDRSRKHPALAVNANGDVLLAWTEGTGWNKGGNAAWQVFDRAGRPVGELGHARGVPVWSQVAAFARPDGGFAVLY